jgi:hypothetical protein
MSIADSRASVREPITALAIVLLGAALSACQSSAGKGAAQGAGTGAIAGAATGALAGLWLEILNYADSGREAKARELFPTLVKQDWNIETTAQAENKMREGVTALGNIREEYKRPRVCAA